MLDKKTIQEVLKAGLATGAEVCEIYAEDTLANSINFTDGMIKDVSSRNDFGVGVRIFTKKLQVYGYSNDVSCDVLKSMTLNLASSFQENHKNDVKPLTQIRISKINNPLILPKDFTLEERIEIIKKCNEYCRNYSNLISQVSIKINDEEKKIMIANSNGLYREDIRCSIRIGIEVVVARGESKEIGYSGPGTSSGFEYFSDELLKKACEETCETALIMLDAQECKSGVMNVIIDNGFGGVIFHEACGHGLEATSVAKNLSVFSNKIGQKVANEVITAIDDGTIPNAWGSNNIDDEGNKTRKTVLIEKGILKNYLIDYKNGMSMNMEANGACRRQSYRYAPTSRMSNTYIDNGSSTFEEIIKATKYGLYAKKLGGGSVDPSTGDFNFAIVEAYMVIDGKISYPVKGATIIGNGPKVLHQIDMVANNLKLDHGVCGAESGNIPTNVGQPTIRVLNVTVGGKGEQA